MIPKKPRPHTEKKRDWVDKGKDYINSSESKENKRMIGKVQEVIF